MAVETPPHNGNRILPPITGGTNVTLTFTNDIGSHWQSVVHYVLGEMFLTSHVTTYYLSIFRFNRFWNSFLFPSENETFTFLCTRSVITFSIGLIFSIFYKSHRRMGTLSLLIIFFHCFIECKDKTKIRWIKHFIILQRYLFLT